MDPCSCLLMMSQSQPPMLLRLSARTPLTLNQKPHDESSGVGCAHAGDDVARLGGMIATSPLACCRIVCLIILTLALKHRYVGGAV